MTAIITVLALKINTHIFFPRQTCFFTPDMLLTLYV